MIRIVAVGKKHEPWLVDAIERYEKRLRKPFDVSWQLLPHSSLVGETARKAESDAILSKLSGQDFVVLLDERGEMLDSPTLAKKLASELDSSKPVVLIIGGAYGVDERVSSRAQFVWSLSKLVFPHQLVRLLLSEQLYRVQSIYQNTPYHNE